MFIILSWLKVENKTHKVINGEGCFLPGKMNGHRFHEFDLELISSGYSILYHITCLNCGHRYNFVHGKYSKWNYEWSCDEMIIKDIIE